MKKFVVLLAFLAVSCSSPAPSAPPDPKVSAWRTRAQGITIVRDDWGVPHIYGKTDADVVFGLMYAQAEDDFNRVETNFINSQGRLAEAEGEAEIWRDLRMKLFIDPEDMKAKYQGSPDWLRKLMDAWADGLNFYLATHPDVKPRVIRQFEPWMALGQFLFEAVVQRGDKQLRVDWTQGTPPGKTEVNECAIQKKDEIPLKAGELVTVRSRVETPGALKLTLTASKL